MHCPIDLPPVLPFLQSGKLRALGIGGLKRSSLLPNVPTIADAGVPGYESNMWWGIMAPGKTSDVLVQRLNQYIRQALDTPEIQRRFAGLGMDIRRSSSREFATIIATDIKKWSAIINAAKVNANSH